MNTRSQYFEDASTGHYQFNVSLLGEAHASCKKSFDDALKQHASASAAAAATTAPASYAGTVVVVDNTNTTRWEYEPYIAAAKAAAAEFVHVVELTLPVPYRSSPSTQSSANSTSSGHRNGGQSWSAHSRSRTSQNGSNHSRKERAVLEALAARNAHGVPLEALVRMLERWEDNPVAFKIPAGGLN